jgi:hypothetical protein
MEQDTDPHRPRIETDRPEAEPVSPARESTERPKATFSVRLTMSGSVQDFEDPHLAGAAFFRADPAERPTVTHVEGNTAWTMARTEIHGMHESGETRYFKSLPDSHAPDAAFRAGFLEAMEASITERLGKVDWSKDRANVAARLDAGLKDDLEAFARREPEKAATLWAARTEDPAPGPELQAALQAWEADADRELHTDQTTLAAKPTVIASGDWVTTDQAVDLRPVAVVTERGVHAGGEAKLPGRESEVTFSERRFANSREALRHAWDFYEGGEDGLARAVTRAAELDRDLAEPIDRMPTGLVVEHRAQPEFPRPETAIYAGKEAQLILTLGRDDAGTRNLADELLADPAFRKLVADHIADAEATLGTGHFTDGADSRGFLPDELLVVTAYGRDGSAEVLAKLPDEGPLSQALARHLVASPVMGAHVEAEQQRENFSADPVRALSTWIAQSSLSLDGHPEPARAGLRVEMFAIAEAAAEAFDVEAPRKALTSLPASTLYSTAIGASALTLGAEKLDLNSAALAELRAGVTAAAREVGIEGTRIGQRLGTGAANAHEEETWVRSDIADVASRHRLDLGDNKDRSRAAELVDRFYERAAEMIHAARSAEVQRDEDPLRVALGSMVRVHESQGAVAFRTEDQARDFAEEMTERYGAGVLKDMAAGRTEALAKDIPDPAARAALAAAVVSAAKEHPALGLSAHEAETAERKLAAQSHAQGRPTAHARAHNHDREF